MLTALRLRHNPVAALCQLVVALLDWRPLLLVGIYVSLAFLLTQVPFKYTFVVGKERGPQSDLPFLYNFNAAEAANDVGRWRWSRSVADIVVPAVGQRGLVVDLQIVSHRAQWAPEQGPTILTVEFDEQTHTPLELRPEGARYQLYVPATTLEDGNLRLGLQTTPWQHPADARENMGVAISEDLTIRSIVQPGFVQPNSVLLLHWSGGLLLLWGTVRLLGFTRNLSLWLLLPVALVIPLLIPLSGPRLGFGNDWIVQASLLALVCGAVCKLAVPPILNRLQIATPPELLRWLLLLLVLTFTIAYSGRFYPASMPGDLQLHVNRYLRTMLGEVYILAQHRGLPFPFPNGLYVLMGPLHLSWQDIHGLFELVDGLMETSGVLLIYLLAARVSGNVRLGLLTAALYTLTAGGFMVTWFAFATQVAGQWFLLLLVTLLAFIYPDRRSGVLWAAVLLLLVLVFLAHIGQFMNLALVGLLMLPLLWWRAHTVDERAAVWWVGSAGLAAGLFVGLFYYGAFAGLFWEQLTSISTVGMNETTGRDPIPREVTLRVIWEGGLITHFGWFPVLLAIPGALAMGTPRLRRSIIPVLVWLSFFVSITQGILPLITLSSITTRWLMFSSWAIILAGAWGLWLLMQRGWAARVVTAAILGYVAWGMLVVWMNAMALRLPPIEPF